MRKIFKYGLISFLLLGVITSCSKYNDLAKNDPTINPSYLYGRLFLTDTLSQNVLAMPLTGKTVTVNYSESADTLDNLYSATTDANGYFKFNNLNANKNYIVRYIDNTGGKIIYVRSPNVKLPQTQLAMVARLKMTGQTGFIISVKDGSGNAVTGANVCLATSMIPYNSATCNGSQYSLVSDVNGHASQFGVGLGTYYIVSNITINNVIYSAKSMVSVKDTVVSQLTINLNLPASPTNQLIIYAYDANQNPLNGAHICLFSSPVLAKRDTCEGSNYSSVTDPTGKAVISNINPGKYYILGQLALTNFKLLGRDSITISSGNFNDALVLK